MHVPAATVTAEVGEAKAQPLSNVVPLAATIAISGFLFGFDTAAINGVLLLLRRQFALSNTFTFLSLVKILNLWGDICDLRRAFLPLLHFRLEDGS